MDCEFHVAGNGPFQSEFQKRHEAGPQGSGARVCFYGAYDPTERVQFLKRFFANVDWLIVPTLDEWETLCMAMLEALQHGVPCIATRTGGLASFELPDLGPAPASAVRLVEPSMIGKVLEEMAASEAPDIPVSIPSTRPEWSAIARNAIKQRSLLKKLGFLQDDGRGVDEGGENAEDETPENKSGSGSNEPVST